MDLESAGLAVLSVCPAHLPLWCVNGLRICLPGCPECVPHSLTQCGAVNGLRICRPSFLATESPPEAFSSLTPDKGSLLPPHLLSAHLSSPSSMSKRKLMPKRSQLTCCALSSHLCPIIHFLFHPLPCLLCFIVPNTVSPVLLLELQEDNHRTTLPLTLIA